jgi:hypothetical protein
MKGKMNPELEVGDRIMCYSMTGEVSVPPGTTGIVIKISKDPFEINSNGKIISVNWDNGSKLSLLSVVDLWKKVSTDRIEEQKEETGHSDFDFFSSNSDIFDNFDWKFLTEYLHKIRESGIVNMLSAQGLLYCGQDHLDRYYGEHASDQEAFDEALEMAEEAKSKMIEGTVNYMQSKNKEIDINSINRMIGILSNKILNVYISFFKWRKKP